jgi:hypothetical protein
MFLKLASKKAKLLEPTTKQKQIKAVVAGILRDKGSITAWDIIKLGTTDGHKVVFRLREEGVIDRDAWEPNANCTGRHKRYYASKAWRAGR